MQLHMGVQLLRVCRGASCAPSSSPECLPLAPSEVPCLLIVIVLSCGALLTPLSLDMHTFPWDRDEGNGLDPQGRPGCQCPGSEPVLTPCPPGQVLLTLPPHPATALPPVHWCPLTAWCSPLPCIGEGGPGLRTRPHGAQHRTAWAPSQELLWPCAQRPVRQEPLARGCKGHPGRGSGQQASSTLPFGAHSAQGWVSGAAAAVERTEHLGEVSVCTAACVSWPHPTYGSTRVAVPRPGSQWGVPVPRAH